MLFQVRVCAVRPTSVVPVTGEYTVGHVTEVGVVNARTVEQVLFNPSALRGRTIQ